MTLLELSSTDIPWSQLQLHPQAKILCSSSTYRAGQRSLPKPKVMKKKPFTKMCDGPIFEMPLTVVMDDQGCGYIPWLVEKCVTFLSESHLAAPGLFRQSGSQSEIQLIAEAFDRGEDVILGEMTSDPSAVAGLLELSPSPLPEPLLTCGRYEQFLERVSPSNLQEREKYARALVDALPEHNYAVLEVMLALLAAVAQNSLANLMDTKNLASILGPTVLYSREERGSRVLKEVHTTILVTQFLIEHREAIFGIQTLDGDITSVYNIDRELGTGAFAVVKVVRHKVTGLEYAAKFIDKSQLASEDKKMLEREVAILRRLRHPHIIALKAVCETPKHLILITELARGGELFDRISAQGAHAEQDVIKITRQLVSAIGYLHTMGIAHRDLKPENILLRDKEGYCVKLADFGLGRIIDEGVAMSTMCGTPSYVAPEVLLGEKYTIAVDMWSVGVITYILLSGRMPFFGKRMQDLAERIITGTYAFPEERWAGVSVSAKEFIKTLLQTDPEKRATAKTAYSHAFLRGQSASSTQLRLDALEHRNRNRQSAMADGSALVPSASSTSAAPAASSISLAPPTATPSGPSSASLKTPHTFATKSFHRPTWCEECNNIVWRNGHQCKGCKARVHRDCIDIFSSKNSCGAGKASRSPSRKEKKKAK